MAELRIVPNLDNFWKGERPERLVDVMAPIVVGGIEGGMASGNPSVGLIIELPDGSTAFAQTSLKLFLMAADVLKLAYGDPRVDPSGPAA